MNFSQEHFDPEECNIALQNNQKTFETGFDETIRNQGSFRGEIQGIVHSNGLGACPRIV